MNDGWYVARICAFVAQCETPIEMPFPVEERSHGPRLCSFVEGGISVMLDFPGNTRAQRPWFRELIECATVEHYRTLSKLPTPYAQVSFGAETRRYMLARPGPAERTSAVCSPM